MSTISYIMEFTSHPLAIAKLPPRRIITLQGNIFSMSLHAMSGLYSTPPLKMFLFGQTIRMNRTTIATVVSVTKPF